MKLFIIYRLDGYDGLSVKEFDNDASAIEFLNENAQNREAEFRVIRGRELRLKPIEIIKSYQLEG